VSKSFGSMSFSTETTQHTTAPPSARPHEAQRAPRLLLSNGEASTLAVSKLPCLKQSVLPKWVVAILMTSTQFFRRIAGRPFQPQTRNVAQPAKFLQRAARATPQASSAEHYRHFDQFPIGFACNGSESATIGGARSKGSHERAGVSHLRAIYPRAFRGCKTARELRVASAAPH
jgi:hypothetical protein